MIRHKKLGQRPRTSTSCYSEVRKNTSGLRFATKHNDNAYEGMRSDGQEHPNEHVEEHGRHHTGIAPQVSRAA